MNIKNLAFVVVVCALAGLSTWGWLKERELHQANDQLNAELMQAKLELGKAHTQFGDAQKYVKELEDRLQQEIRAHNELLTQYGELLAKYNAQGGGHSNTPNPVTPPVDTGPVLVPGTIYVAQTNSVAQPFTPPVSYSLGDNRLDINVEVLTEPKGALKYTLATDISYKLHLSILAHFAQTITESGAVNNYAELYEVDSAGNKLGKFEVTSFEYVVDDLRKPKLRWWAPHLDVAVIGGWSQSGLLTGASIGLSIAGYGKTANDLTVRFPRVGLNVTKGIGLDISPVVFNIADPLPIISNIWLGPFVSATLGHGYGGGVLLGAVL